MQMGIKIRHVLSTLLFVLCCTFSMTTKAETYVVVAGVADYRTINDLILPEKDAQAVAKLYKTKTNNVILLTGKYATKKRILASLKQQFTRATEDDCILFFFSGHGYPGGICPYDIAANRKESGVSYKEILSVIKSSRAKTKMIFADACFSGGLRSNGSHSAEQTVKGADVLLFLSSRTGETSIESPFMTNGYFTSALIRGLRGGADTNRDRKITAKELFLFVNQRVVEKTNDRQHPVMWGRFDNDDVVIEW